MDAQQFCHDDPCLERVLFSETEVQQIVHRLAAEIAQQHGGEQVFLIGVLKGACLFVADLGRELMRAGCQDVRIDFCRASAYGDSVKQEGEKERQVKIVGPWGNVRGQNVVIVDDILDQGFTMAALKRHFLQELGAARVQTCAFLEKELRNPSPEARAKRASTRADYVGAQAPDCWVVGYGLDAAEKYRCLPFVAVAKEECFR